MTLEHHHVEYEIHLQMVDFTLSCYFFLGGCTLNLGLPLSKEPGMIIFHILHSVYLQIDEQMSN